VFYLFFWFCIKCHISFVVVVVAQVVLLSCVVLYWLPVVFVVQALALRRYALHGFIRVSTFYYTACYYYHVAIYL